MATEPLEEWPFGTRVEIGGRTMLRPGFSLVGLTGMIYLTAPNAPAGCQTVIVDWAKDGYTPEAGYPEGSLPMIVNVPREHLTLFDEQSALTEEKAPEEKAPEEKKPFRPRLRGVDNVGDVAAPVLKDDEEIGPELPTPPTQPPAKPQAETPKTPENERPKLRLV